MSQPARMDAWTANEKRAKLEKVSLPLRALEAHEVCLEVLACGVCHSDLHLIDDDWFLSKYPLVPGHEIFGRVIAAGTDVEGLETGALVGVGWQRAACLVCDACLSSRENLCQKMLPTCVGHPGGYASHHISDSRFCFPIPEAITKPDYSPLLCGGITVFSPYYEFISTHNAHVGVVGVGGLGHLAIKFAAAMGFEITVFSSSTVKREEAKRWGSHHFISSTDDREIIQLGRRLDLVLVTANADLPWQAYLQTLRADGTLCFVGIPPSAWQLNSVDLLGQRLRIAGSPIGGRNRIRQMLEFAALHKITPQAEIYPLAKVNEALLRVRENRVRYRAVVTT